MCEGVSSRRPRSKGARRLRLRTDIASMIPPNERNVNTKSPQYVEGRARNYGYQGGSLSDCHVGAQMGDLRH